MQVYGTHRQGTLKQRILSKDVVLEWCGVGVVGVVLEWTILWFDCRTSFIWTSIHVSSENTFVANLLDIRNRYRLMYHTVPTCQEVKLQLQTLVANHSMSI